jgi:hypothetical protein
MTDSNSSPYNLPWEFEIFEGQGPFDIQLNNEQFSSEFVDDNGNGGLFINAHHFFFTLLSLFVPFVYFF